MGRQQGDPQLRDRLAAWLDYIMRTHHIPTQIAMAKRLGYTSQAINQVQKRRRDVGLEFAVRLHRTFHVSLDALVDSDPPGVGSEVAGTLRRPGRSA